MVMPLHKCSVEAQSTDDAGARTLKQPALIIPEVALTPAAFEPALADAPAALLIVEPVAAAPTPEGAAVPAEAPGPDIVRFPGSSHDTESSCSADTPRACGVCCST